MKKAIYLLFFIFLTATIFADWTEGDPFKMHYPQLPNPAGWDIKFGDGWLGDDFLCTETGQITDIHFWVSWAWDEAYWPDLQFIGIGIWSDLRVGVPYSQPENELWYRDFDPTQFVIAGPWDGLQGWFDPYTGFYEEINHQLYYQINIESIPDPFWQTADTIYWLVIFIPFWPTPPDIGLGWKTSIEHFEDDAVYGFPGAWNELIDPSSGESLDLAFVITNDDQVPVQLSSFTAAYSNDSPTLFWTTQSESNNMGWNVFRSDNDDLEESLQINLDLIPGAGTSSEPTDYIFEDEYEVVVNNQYYYWIESVETSGETETYGPISLTIPEEGEDPGTPEIPDIYGLHQNYPNPFNPNTRISYRMQEDCIGTLKVYNLRGEKVATLFENREMAADEKDFVEWNSKDSEGKPVPSGVYIYELNTNVRNYSRKMVLTK